MKDSERPRPDGARRRFLGGAAAAIGSAAVAPAGFGRDAESGSGSEKKVLIGIVGGRFGASFQWHLHPGCEVAAVSDLRSDRLETLRKTYRCTTTYPSLEELVKDRSIDAVGVFTEAPN